MSLNVILAVATILGGIAAIWFFWEKWAKWRRPDPLENPSRENIERVVLKSDPIADWTKSHTNEKQTASYVHNPNLRFEMDHSPRGIQCENFREEWANRHPDSSATGFWCDLYFGSTLINRFILVGVDGVRALLPPPRDAEGRPGGTVVQPLDYKVAQIHDTLGTLDEYLGRSRLTRADAV